MVYGFTGMFVFLFLQSAFIHDEKEANDYLKAVGGLAVFFFLLLAFTTIDN